MQVFGWEEFDDSAEMRGLMVPYTLALMWGKKSNGTPKKQCMR
jgi:hypothetical protein